MGKNNRGAKRGPKPPQPNSLPTSAPGPTTAPSPPLASSPPTTPSPPPPNLGPTETDKVQNRRINWTLAISLASLLVSVLSACFSCRSSRESAAANALNRAAQDRAAGKVKARFELVEEKDRDPNRDKPFLRKKDGYDQQVFRIESVDELSRWGPYVRVKNTGTEPIDAMKIEVGYFAGMAYGQGVNQIDPAPIVYNETLSREATGFGKLMPGQTAKVTLAPLFLHQITNLKWTDFPDNDHMAILTVNVLCRMVGAASYDRVEDKQPLAFTFHWRPAGFRPTAKHVKELLEHKPSVEIQ